MGLEPSPAPDLALEAVGVDHDVGADVERVSQVLAAGADHLAILAQEVDRTRLDHNIRAGFRRLAREEPIEEVSFQDVPALVACARLVEDERRSVRSDDPGAVDLVTNELAARRQSDFLEPSFRDALAASDRRADFGSLLDQEDIGAPQGRILLRRDARGYRAAAEYILQHTQPTYL